MADWIALPERLWAPRAVLLDERTGHLLFLLDAAGQAPQLVVALDYFRKTPDGARRANIAVSAYRPFVGDLVGRVAGGILSVLAGVLS